MSKQHTNTVTLSLEEYERLKEVNRSYQELLHKLDADPVCTIAIKELSWHSERYWVKNPDELHKKMASEIESLRKQYDKLAQLDVPKLSLSNLKVRDLLIRKILI